MSQHGPQSRRPFQAVIVTILCLIYVGAGVYFRAVLGTTVVYPHLAYVPLVLAGLWWGRRAVLLAAVLGAALLILDHLPGAAPGDLWGNLGRGCLFLVFTLVIGALSERLGAARDRLAGSERRYRTLVEKSQAGVFVYRGENILLSNSCFARMVGEDPQALVGRSFWEFFHEDDRPAMREQLARRARGESTDLRYECRVLGRGHEPRWADVASSATEYEGSPAVLVSLYDISEKKEAETKRRELSRLASEQEEQLMHSTRLAEMGELAAGVAHELNQPLTGIRNFARNAFYMLEQNAGSIDEVKSNLRMISDQVDRASKIIGQMRELARRSEREVVALDLNAVISESLEFLMPQMTLAGVEVVRESCADLPAVRGDRVRIEQVFLNLFTNARQAMEDCPRRVLTVRTRLEPDEPLPVVAEVADSGKGFDEAGARAMFKPFYSTKKTGHGTGLGLSISLKIVEDHGGRLLARGEVGSGATFAVRLPAAEEKKREGASDNA